MTDTIRSQDVLLTAAADNTVGDYSLQDLRDVIISTAAIRGTADPSAGAGVAADAGTLYVRNNAGTYELWFKTAAGNTAWSKIL